MQLRHFHELDALPTQKEDISAFVVIFTSFLIKGVPEITPSIADGENIKR